MNNHKNLSLKFCSPLQFSAALQLAIHKKLFKKLPAKFTNPQIFTLKNIRLYTVFTNIWNKSAIAVKALWSDGTSEFQSVAAYKILES